jgi:uncharacterized NAD-dependent epimerase/dehydratase family protein
VEMQSTQIAGPFLLFLGDSQDSRLTKTAAGVHHWCPEMCKGQLRLDGETVDLGLADITPKKFQERYGSGTLIIGVANVGGIFPNSWIKTLVSALEHGLDIASGMHSRLADISPVSEAAHKYGRQLFDVRFPSGPLVVGTGKKRSGKRLLTVGTDCVVGKMYTALEITREMQARGAKVDFRATGQTGILIAGSGICVDAVVADFISGAAEMISPNNENDHWDIIEGQGSLSHPGYAGVSLGLLHGSQPDALVLCHEPDRKLIAFSESYPVPDIQTTIDKNSLAAKLTNPAAEVVGISLNSKSMERSQANDYIRSLQQLTGLPVVDPVRTGVGAIVDRLLQ